MKNTLTAIAFVCIAGPSFAQGYAEHDGVRNFTEKPCTQIFEILEGEEPDIVSVGVNGMVDWMANYGMTWGFILGYDTARGGLHEGDKTTLSRLRVACEASPEKTAFEILESF